MELPTMSVNDGFTSYMSHEGFSEEPHYGETLNTPNGDQLQWTHAKYLKPILTEGPESAYIRALDDGCRIALYWH